MGQVGVGSGGGATAAADVSLGLFGQGLYKVRGHSLSSIPTAMAQPATRPANIFIPCHWEPLVLDITCDQFPCSVPEDSDWWTLASHAYVYSSVGKGYGTHLCDKCGFQRTTFWCVMRLEKIVEIYNGIPLYRVKPWNCSENTMCCECVEARYKTLRGCINYKAFPDSAIVRFLPAVPSITTPMTKSARN